MAALPFLLSMLLALIAFPLDSGAGYLHYVGYPSTVLYNYRYAGHAWEALVNSPYLMEGAMVLVIGLLGALYAVAGCLLTPFFRRNRILSLLAFPTALLIISFCLQAFGIDRYVWFLYFIASPDITLNLKDLWISLGVFACVIAALGLLQRKVCADEIS